MRHGEAPGTGNGEECVSHGLKQQQQEKQMSVPAESWAVEGVSGSNAHPGSSLWALGSQRINKQRHHCRKAMTCPRRVSQKPWEEITISLPRCMSCASGGHWYNLISFQYHSCKGFWEFFFFFLIFPTSADGKGMKRDMRTPI